MAGKINAEAVKITESMWLSKNTGGNKLVAYYPVTDTTKVLATEDGVSGDISGAISTHNSDNTAHTAIQDKIGTDISTHNSDNTAHTAIQDKIGTDIGTHNSDSSAHTDIQTKIGTDIGTHNSDSSAHTAIQTKIGTDIGTHNSSGTAHSDIRTLIADITLAILTQNLFRYENGMIVDSGGGYWSGGDSSAAFDVLTANDLTTKNPTVNNTLTQKNSTPSIYFEQTCGSNGLPEIFRKTPADSVPVNVGSPFMSGTHWGVASNTPVSTVKYDGTNPCGWTFRKFNQITSGELQFGANTNNRLYFPSSSSIAVGQRYIATCMFRAVAINGQTPPSCNYRLYLTIPTVGTLYVMTYSNVTPPAYNADGNSQLLSMEGVIDVLGVDANNLMFCMSSATCSTLVQPTKYVSKTYSDANKPYFSLWASDTNLNVTYECYLADMSLYRIK